MQQVSPTALRFRVGQPERDNPRVMDALAARRAPLLTFQEVPRSLEQVYLKVMAGAQGGSHVQ
jgi:hypothetical protein